MSSWALWLDHVFVPCDHEYLNFKGGKFSKSRGTVVDVPYYLSKYDPDPLRYYLTAVAPETRDTEFAWEEFVERNNNELVATWGNLVNRTLSLVGKNVGEVPAAGTVAEADKPKERLVVDYDGRAIPYDTIEMDELTLAYAITVHKSQGSEYPAVVIPLLTQHYIMLQRNLWERSGHWENYRENMYTSVIDDTDVAIKPMNCPGGMLVYTSRHHSYMYLPIRHS